MGLQVLEVFNTTLRRTYGQRRAGLQFAVWDLSETMAAPENARRTGYVLDPYLTRMTGVTRGPVGVRTTRDLLDIGLNSPERRNSGMATNVLAWLDDYAYYGDPPRRSPARNDVRGL